jgi:hypothetical protein
MPERLVAMPRNVRGFAKSYPRTVRLPIAGGVPRFKPSRRAGLGIADGSWFMESRSATASIDTFEGGHFGDYLPDKKSRLAPGLK